MNRGFPCDATIETALALAVRAPSVHNTQPWRWRVGPRTVHLYADPGRQLSVADPDQRDLVLSCGAALHHLRVALRALGWTATVRHLPNPADPDHLASIELSSHEPSTADCELGDAITRRQTDRRRYTSWPVPVGHLALMIERAGEFGVVVQRVSVPVATPELMDPTHRPDAAELLVLATSSDDRRSWLLAGEAISAVLLTATNLDLAGCLLTEPLEIADLRAGLRRDVLDDNAYPQAIIRVGCIPAGAAPLPYTARHAVEDVIDPFVPAAQR